MSSVTSAQCWNQRSLLRLSAGYEAPGGIEIASSSCCRPRRISVMLSFRAPEQIGETRICVNRRCRFESEGVSVERPGGGQHRRHQDLTRSSRSAVTAIVLEVTRLALPEMAWPHDRRDVKLYGHQNRGLLSDRSRPVSAPAVSGCDAALILAERQVARTHLDACPVHGLNPPSAGQRHDPLRRGVFVPVPEPPYRLHRKDRRGFAAWLPVVPLRIRVTNALQLERGQFTTLLMTDAALIAPEMPVAKRRARSGIGDSPLCE